MDGWAVLSKLKADPTTAHIPVIMSTIVSDRNMGFALGATDYVTKPVDRDQMLRIVNKYRCATDACPVLIVEDDDAARQMMRDMLETHGWQVLEAINGAAGLDVLLHTRPDVILLDLMMPQMNGFEFLRRLRLNDKWADIPVVVITAMDLTPQHYDELMQSVQQIIQKGDYQAEDLVKEVRYWARVTQKT
jgi:CheY-like chemotaxis protein